MNKDKLDREWDQKFVAILREKIAPSGGPKVSDEELLVWFRRQKCFGSAMLRLQISWLILWRTLLCRTY